MSFLSSSNTYFGIEGLKLILDIGEDGLSELTINDAFIHDHVVQHINTNISYSEFAKEIGVKFDKHTTLTGREIMTELKNYSDGRPNIDIDVLFQLKNGEKLWWQRKCGN
tara:strand:+ start:6853 stop:7182 length:330 start_codon:yes stop_codon:yes gene_type:complete